MEHSQNGIIPFLPHLFRQGDKVPSDLIGATIIRFGTTGSADVVVDYKPRNGSPVKRLVLRFNDRGLWIDRQTTLFASCATQDTSQ